MTNAALAIGLSGCLVTDKISFASAPEQPPQIVNVGGGIPIGSIFWVDKRSIGSGWTMSVGVIDDNLSETLVAHYRLAVGDPSLDQTIEFFKPQQLPPQGQRTRTLVFQVLTEELVELHCYRLDLAVSAHFTYVNQSDPNKTDFDGLEPGFTKDSVAVAQWWVLEGDRDSLSPDDANQAFVSCATNQIGGDAGTRTQ